LDAWAVGEGGVMLHWDGMKWSEVSSGFRSSIHGFWGASPDDVWAVGGDILHWDGNNWSKVDGVPYWSTDIYGFSADDIWVVTGRGIVYHWNGLAWDFVNLNVNLKLWAVWGSSPNDIWVVGENGIAFNYDGDAWARVSTGTGQDINDIWGVASDDIWAVADFEVLLHWDGMNWTCFDIETPPFLTIPYLEGIWGTASDQFIAVGELSEGEQGSGAILKWDGNSWTYERNKVRGLQVWGTAPEDIWIAGREGEFYHNGVMNIGTYMTFNGLWGIGNHVWVGGSGILYHRR